jgi:hypothetical protein
MNNSFGRKAPWNFASRPDVEALSEAMQAFLHQHPSACDKSRKSLL